MKKISTALLMTLLLSSCAVPVAAPVGRVTKITSPKEGVIHYPGASLLKGEDINLIRVFWTMGRRNESLVMPGKVKNVLGSDNYEVVFEGEKSISETNIVRKSN